MTTETVILRAGNAQPTLERPVAKPIPLRIKIYYSSFHFTFHSPYIIPI